MVRMSSSSTGFGEALGSPRFEPLGDDNYKTWSTYCRAYLRSRELWAVVVTPRPDPKGDGGLTALTSWERKDQLALSHIQLCVKPHVLRIVEACDSAGEAWSLLHDTFQARTTARRSELLAALTGLTMGQHESVLRYLTRAKALREDLVEAGQRVDEETLVMQVLAGLPPSFDMVRAVLEDRDSVPSLDLVISRLHRAEQRSKARASAKPREADNSPRVALEAAIMPTKPTTPVKRKGSCHYCGKPGHWRPECNARKADEKRGVNQACRPGVGGGFPGTKGPGKRSDGAGTRGSSSRDTKGAANSATYLALSAVSRSHDNRPRGSMWVVDSGATHHMTPESTPFGPYNPVVGDHVTLANDSDVAIAGRGVVQLTFNGRDGPSLVSLHDAVHVPSLSRNLLSVGAVDRRGGAVVFVGGRCYILCDGASVAKNIEVNNADLTGQLMPTGQYVLNAKASKVSSCAAVAVQPAEATLWHRRFNHLGIANLRRAVNMTTGIPQVVETATPVIGTVCPPCAEGRLTRAPFPSTNMDTNATEPLELVHTDLGGPLPTSLGGCRFYVSIVDTATRLKVALPIRGKEDAAATLQAQFLRLETLAKKKVRRVRHDGGGEYLSSGLLDFYKRRGIIAETTAPYTPQQNGTAERFNRTVLERIRSMLSDSGADQDLWAEALAAAVYVLNRSPVDGLDVTPIEAFTGKKPDVSHLRVWGGTAWALQPTKHHRKLDSRTILGRFVGYTPAKGYRVLPVGSDTVLVRRDVLVDEVGLRHATSTSLGDPNYHSSTDLSDADPYPHVSSGQIINSPPTTPSLSPSSSNGVSSSDTISGAQSNSEDTDSGASEDHAERRYPLRHRRPTVSFWETTPGATADLATMVEAMPAPYDVNQSPTFSQLYPDGKAPPPPKTVFDAMRRPDWSHWQRAIQDEVQSLSEKGAYRIVPPPSGRRLTSSRFVFDYKRDADGNITRHKARLVVRGFSQVAGIDYGETWAPVPSSATVRTFLAAAAHNDWELHHIDIRTAYLNAAMDREIYISQPEGWRLGPDGWVCRVLRAIYGSRQAGRLWHDELDKGLQGEGAKVCAVDACTYRAEHPLGVVFLTVHVDDVLLASPSLEALTSIKRAIGRRYDCRDLGEAKSVLGMRVSRNRPARLLYLSSPGHVKALLQAYGMTSANPAKTPMTPGVDLSPTGSEQPLGEGNKYAELVGALLYLSTATRPDIAFAVGVLTRHMASPSGRHWAAAKTVLRYLAGTPTAGLRLGGGPDLVGACDADFAGDRQTRRSTTGFIFRLFGGPVSWRSRRQTTVAASTAEAEYVAASEAVLEAVWLRQVANFFDAGIDRVHIANDSQACIAMASNPLGYGRAKHIDVRCHIVKERVATGEVRLQYVPTSKMPADGLTKPLAGPAFTRFRQAVGVHECMDGDRLKDKVHHA